MRKGLIISVLLHAGLLVYALGFYPNLFGAHKKLTVTKMVPISIVTPSAVSKVKAGSKKAKKDGPAKATPKTKKKAEKAKQPKKKVVKAKPKAKPKKKPKKVVKAKPKPAPKPVKKVAKPKQKAKPLPVKKAAKPKPVKKKVAKKKPPKPIKQVKRKPRPKPKVKRSFEDEMAALLNKQPDEPAAQPTGRDNNKKNNSKHASRGRSYGRDDRMSANEIDAFRAQIAQCWNPPVGGFGAGRLAVKLRLQLRKNGSIAQQPRLMNRQSSPFFQAAADSAIRAVLQCQPYRMPSAKYGGWKDMVLTFDPRQMMGGF